uniref:FtsX-like permease family protein n=1 Tax=Candidatus Kentrum sp. FW TaxID=2126338 RepID=A0A450SYI2_9GAMM|nr:MAG: hypothetical protein BECKFW1821A_GA0114235_108910 [Candidatus Kentron sp. FW]
MIRETHEHTQSSNSSLSFVWVTLGWREFGRPFSRGCWTRSCPGGRDLFWLTLFFVFAMSFGLLILGTRNGLLNSFSNTFLGYVPQYGIPLALAPHPGAGDFGIDRKVQSDIVAVGKDEKTVLVPGLRAFPYQGLGGGANSSPHFAKLPGSDIWKQGEDIPPYYGWAILEDDPLWTIDKTARTENGLPLALILNRSVFKNAFDYSKYQQVLRSHLPKDWWERDLPISLDKLKALWLFVLVGRQSELVRFQVHWVENIPGASRPAFLYPLGTLRALEEAKANPLLRYFPEALDGKAGGNGARMTGLIVLGGYEDTAAPNERTREFARCLDGEMAQDGEDAAISLPYPKPAVWMTACRSQAGIGQDRIITNTVSGHALSFTQDGFLEIPCDSISEAMARDINAECRVRRLSILGNYPGETIRRLAQCTSGNVTDAGYTLELPDVSQSVISVCAAKSGIPAQNLPPKEGIVSLDRIKGSRIIIYVPDRNGLSEAIDRLLGITIDINDTNIRALSLTPAYKDAVNRVNYLTDTIGSIALPYGALFSSLMLLLLWVILGTLIGHRRERYAVLLARGISWWQIYAMVYFQVILSSTLGLAMAWFADKGMRHWIGGRFIGIFEEYRDILGLTDIPALVSTSHMDYLYTFLAFTILACLIATVFLRMAPITRKADIADLLQI